MSNILNVTIASTSPPLLNVEDNGGQNQVSQSPNPQTIKWQLNGTAARGAFLPMDHDPPGFCWVTTPSPQEPNGPFGVPQVGSSGNSLTITDNHTSAATNGSWIYKLHVILDGVVYSTTSSLGPAAGINNPIIVNR
jgi:hypothetical protein